MDARVGALECKPPVFAARIFFVFVRSEPAKTARERAKREGAADAGGNSRRKAAKRLAVYGAARRSATRTGGAICPLALTLFVVCVLRAYYHNLAVALNDLAFIAHRLYGRSYFHCCYSLKFVSVGYSALGYIVGRHFELDGVADQYLNVVHSYLARNGASNDMSVG
jgi:hypothetical protein